MKRLTVVLTTLLVLTVGIAPPAVAGAAAPLPDHSTPADVDTAAPSLSAPVPALSTAQSDLNLDAPVGCVDGVCHDDELGFDEPTNLTDDELDVLVDRTMARVEQLRGQKFTDAVAVEVQDRASFREDNVMTNTDRDQTYERWNDQVWEGLFVVGKDQRSGEVIDSTVGEAVNGFYLPGENRIVIISSNPDSPSVSERTLLHELGHAMQHQYHNLEQPKYRGETQDADLAVDGVIEGEAAYLEGLYDERCTSGQWDCFDGQPTAGGNSAQQSNTNPGILFLLLQPYSDGPAYIHDVRTTEGWAGVDERMESPPTTTSEIISQQSVDSPSLDVPDESTEGWERYPEQGVGGAEVTGEASIYVMFWYQAREYGADTIDPAAFTETSQPYDRYNYTAAPSDGWAGDELYPYQRGDDDGYVWTIEWDAPEDVSEFTEAYTEILAAHDVAETDTGVYIISQGEFSGAYGIETDGTRVTIVHAPTEEGLFELRPSLEPTATDDDDSTVVDDTIPGFGMGAALAALLAVAAAGRRVG